jgi:hypothetical protein
MAGPSMSWSKLGTKLDMHNRNAVVGHARSILRQDNNINDIIPNSSINQAALSFDGQDEEVVLVFPEGAGLSQPSPRPQVMNSKDIGEELPQEDELDFDLGLEESSAVEEDLSDEEEGSSVDGNEVGDQRFLNQLKAQMDQVDTLIASSSSSFFVEHLGRNGPLFQGARTTIYQRVLLAFERRVGGDTFERVFDEINALQADAPTYNDVPKESGLRQAFAAVNFVKPIPFYVCPGCALLSLSDLFFGNSFPRGLLLFPQ